MIFLSDFFIEKNIATIQSVFGVFLPIALSLLYFLFAILVFRFNRIDKKTKQITLNFVLISFYLILFSFNPDNLWVNSIQAGLLLIISILQIYIVLNSIKYRSLQVTIKLVFTTLTFLILLTQLIVNMLDIKLLNFGNTGLLNFWSGILLIIFGNIFFFTKNKDCYRIENSFAKETELIRLFVLIPSGFWFIFNFNQTPGPGLLFPFLLGLLWFAVIFVAFVQRNLKLNITNEMKAYPFVFLVNVLIGLFILLISIFGTSTSELNDKSLLLVGVYIIAFFMGLYFYNFKQNSTPARINEIKTGLISLRDQSLTSRVELLANFEDFISQSFKPEEYVIYSLDPNRNRFYPLISSGQSGGNLFFSEDSSLVQLLMKTNKPIILEKTEGFPKELEEEKELLKLLGSNTFIPMRTEQHFFGWVSLALDDNEKGNFHSRELSLLPIFNEYAGLIKRMDDQMILEQREKNFNVLSRIVKGVNYTLVLDDIYELIFAQTSQVISFDDFFIILKEELSPKLRFVFYVEKDERVHKNENQFVLLSESLEAKVIKSGLGVIANNYPNYCRTNDLDSQWSEIKNALVVPLNTGDKTNGCLFLGKRQSDEMFSTEQLELLQSIADLAAGAIEKARLLDKTEQYAHQLALLNNIVRELSTITNVEQLMKSILSSSIKLMNFAESRLIILDQYTENYIYLEVNGEKSLPLLGKNFTGNTEWFDIIQKSKNLFVLDQNSNMVPKIVSYYKNQDISIMSIMVLPLVIKEKIIGFVELINREGEHYFSENEKQLMQSYTAQAAIAWENARLYQQTDQELNERVEELSIMQKIDRELNSSLDTQTTMKITLSWAIKWMQAGAGWIGLVNENQISLVYHLGYDEGAGNVFPERIKLENLTQQKSDQLIETKKIESKEIETFHSFTKDQIFSPVYRENELIAIIVLEMFDEISLSINQKRFLERLSDHASIAILNSKLYEEIQKANLAKSEFVSLVAHELKNPMTSIKGYTELLTTEAAGEISETQLNFLSIIRNNTERMNALVSDLNDLTKIETGNIHLGIKPVDIKIIIDDLGRSLKNQIEQKNQTFNVRIEDDLPEIKADPDRLSQILVNLVSNANKYSPENSKISLVVEKTDRAGDKKFIAPMAHVFVQDNGFGISESDQEFIFKKFFRSEDENIRRMSGTGLGLNITRSFVEMMGGAIWFESEVGKGTTFHVVVPFVENS